MVSSVVHKCGVGSQGPQYRHVWSGEEGGPRAGVDVEACLQDFVDSISDGLGGLFQSGLRGWAVEEVVGVCHLV